MAGVEHVHEAELVELSLNGLQLADVFEGQIEGEVFVFYAFEQASKSFDTIAEILLKIVFVLYIHNLINAIKQAKTVIIINLYEIYYIDKNVIK